MRVNNAGQATGASYTSLGKIHAFLYSDGKMIDLTPWTWRNTTGTALNDAGQVTGEEYGLGAFLYSDGQLLNLTSTGGRGIAINDSGQVTGYFFGSSGSQAFLYSNGQFMALPSPRDSGGQAIKRRARRA